MAAADRVSGDGGVFRAAPARELGGPVRHELVRPRDPESLRSSIEHRAVLARHAARWRRAADHGDFLDAPPSGTLGDGRRRTRRAYSNVDGAPAAVLVAG